MTHSSRTCSARLECSSITNSLETSATKMHHTHFHIVIDIMLIKSNYSKLGGLGLPVSFQTFEYGFPNAPKDKRLRGVNVVRSFFSFLRFLGEIFHPYIQTTPDRHEDSSSTNIRINTEPWMMVCVFRIDTGGRAAG